MSNDFTTYGTDGDERNFAPFLKPVQQAELVSIIGAYLNDHTVIAPDVPDVWNVIEKHVKAMVSELQDCPEEATQ